MSRSMTLFVIGMMLAVISTALWIGTAWQWPFFTLFTDADTLPIEQAAVKMALLPEIMVALLAGGLLSLASAALQHIVRNTLAADNTLAISSGAQLALMLVTLFFPLSGMFGSFWVALCGAVISVSVVLFLSALDKANPLAIILSGMVVNIFFAASAAVLVLFYNEQLYGIMVWGSGSLSQDGWNSTIMLLVATVISAFLFMLLSHPLRLLSLDDAQAARLGAPVKWLRYAVLLISAGLTALVVSEVGVIGFVGLGGVSIVNALQIRHFNLRLLSAFIAGGLLLLITSNSLNLISYYTETALPAGSFTSLFGAPLLFWLILRQHKSTYSPDKTQNYVALKRVERRYLLIISSLLLILLLVFLLGFVNTLNGWRWLWDWHLIENHRLTRSITAMATGAMLAAGGTILQRITQNPIASPEVLGISSGAALAIISAFVLFPGIGSIGLMGAGTIGSLSVLGLVLWLSRKLQPAWLLLTGIAIGGLTQAIMSIIQLSGNPTLTAILSWLSGTTYRANEKTLWILTALSLLTIGATFFFMRPLKILGLGKTIAHNLGVNVTQAHTVLLFLVAFMSAAATLAVGPMSFIGLMTPHLARSLGAVTPEKQLPLAIILGSGLLLISDWLGRYLIFPYEISAGTFAAFLGGGYFLLLVWQRRSI
ncbi:Fe(3+)-hydroxamate ABC transporter permease FhuB [Aggregatibacter actinomycetemcomitans]|nr:Fe(3+)-hydroxamate ABC transporter permease FhuB [Aggregatibacter actinomycetemcomitans]